MEDSCMLMETCTKESGRTAWLKEMASSSQRDVRSIVAGSERTCQI
jgi:hypothetical protein